MNITTYRGFDPGGFACMRALERGSEKREGRSRKGCPMARGVKEGLTYYRGSPGLGGSPKGKYRIWKGGKLYSKLRYALLYRKRKRRSKFSGSGGHGSHVKITTV